MQTVATEHRTSAPPLLGRVIRNGNSVSVRLPKGIRQSLQLMVGDILCLRVFGNLLVMERLPTEGVARPKDVPASILPPQLRPQGG